MEIERKYLVVGDGWRAAEVSSVMIRQGYLSLDPDRTVRVRSTGCDAWVALKGRTYGVSRDEYEYPIPPGEAAAILDRLCIKPLVEKTRHSVLVGNATWSIDEFHGANAGLLVAEIEIAFEGSEIVRPEWIGEEVSSDARYFNVNLVRKPYSRWGC